MIDLGTADVIDLGTGPALPSLARVTLSIDELDFLLVHLALDELPVVLAQQPRFDNAEARSAAFESAAESLTQRGLLNGDVVDAVLADRLRVLNRPNWVLAFRLFRGEAVSRLCIARGADTAVLALRGPDTLVLEDTSSDPGAVAAAALGTAEPLPLTGFSAPTVELGAVFDDPAVDTAEATRRISEIATPAREADVIATAMTQCYAHTEIVAVRYGDGTRTQAPTHVAVFDTRGGRFVAATSVAADGTRWSALSSGSTGRIRQAVNDLVASLAEPPDFAPAFSP